ncbi:MAG: hypothetical protein HRF43_02450 [Phycisphaerae bacterium]
MPDLPTQDSKTCQNSSAAWMASRPAPAGRQTVWWMIAILLAVIATTLVVRRDEPAFLSTALGQAFSNPRANLEGGRGIYAFPGQIRGGTYGLFMLDVDTGTVWCYELQRTGATGEPRLNLVAARSWVFDRYLEEFNTGSPIPSEVRAMIQHQRGNRPPGTQPGAGTGPE